MEGNWAYAKLNNEQDDTGAGVSSAAKFRCSFYIIYIQIRIAAIENE